MTTLPTRATNYLVLIDNEPKALAEALRKGVQLARLERGDLCVLTVSQQKIGAALWLAIGPGVFREDWDDMRYTCQFPAGVGWTYDGKGTRWGAWGTLMARLPDLLDPFSVHELVTLIDCNNWQSLDAHRSLGYENIGAVGSIGALGLVCSVCRSRDRRWHRLPARIGSVEILNRPPS